MTTETKGFWENNAAYAMFLMDLLRDRGQKMAESPWQHSDTGDLHLIMKRRAELDVRSKVRKFAERLDEHTGEWTPRDEPIAVSLAVRTVQEWINDRARNISNKSTDALHNMVEELKLEALVRVHTEMQNAADRGER